MENEDGFLLQSSSLQRCSNKLSPSFHLIPGPAGTVQSAMLQRRSTRPFLDCGAETHIVVSTQECIRRAVEEKERGHEGDFLRRPWLSAVNFLSDEMRNPLSDLRFFVDKVPRIVAIINSCSPNGSGGMMALLEDPTGYGKASIHRSVFADEDFKENISVGSVLVLQEVAVFSPSPSVRYLNIIHNNVIKVFPKDAISAQDEVVPIKGVHVPSSSLSQERRETILVNESSKGEDDELIELGAREDKGGAYDEVVQVACDSQGNVSAAVSSSLVKVSLPEWTDEQLDLLFAFD